VRSLFFWGAKTDSCPPDFGGVTREKVYVLVVLPDLTRDVITGATNALPSRSRTETHPWLVLISSEAIISAVHFGMTADVSDTLIQDMINRKTV
jgi:hypothetical protein